MRISRYFQEMQLMVNITENSGFILAIILTSVKLRFLLRRIFYDE